MNNIMSNSMTTLVLILVSKSKEAIRVIYYDGYPSIQCPVVSTFIYVLWTIETKFIEKFNKDDLFLVTCIFVLFNVV